VAREGGHGNAHHDHPRAAGAAPEIERIARRTRRWSSEVARILLEEAIRTLECPESAGSPRSLTR
jgi:hypothetical protein